MAPSARAFFSSDLSSGSSPGAASGAPEGAAPARQTGQTGRPPATRQLGVIDASMLVVGSIVGAGIFLVSPDVAKCVRTPGAFLGAWAIGGVVALAGALSNGELGGMFPRSGGEYVYLREAYGPRFGFLSGWTAFWIAFPGSIAALASGFGRAMAGILRLPSPGAPVAIGVAAILVLTAVNACGLHAGKWVQNSLSMAKLCAFAVLLALGFFVGHGSVAWFAPPGDLPDHRGGIVAALVSVFFAYTGWNAATYVAGEMREPTRGLAKALALGTSLCIVLYLAVNYAYLRALPLGELAMTAEPARVTAIRLGGRAAANVLAPLVAVCVLSSLQATVLVGPRVYHAMAHDGLFFSPLGRLHPRVGAPVNALVVQAFIAVAELVSGSFDQLLAFAMFAIMAFSTMAVVAVFVLRVRRPDALRPFRVPGYPFVPALFVVVNAWVLWSVLQYKPLAAAFGLAIVATGVPAYSLLRRKIRSEESA
jgi:APA family basic amino acid/polyamine antiporter